MKLHPLTVPLRGLSRAASAVVTLVFLGTAAAGVTGVIDPLAVVPLALAGGVLALAYELAYYRRFEYVLTDDTLDIASGVFSRRHREIPYRRIQNIDVSQRFLHRALGVAAVAIETAGGGGTEASLSVVGYDEAQRLQGELGRRSRGETGTDTGEAAPGADSSATDRSATSRGEELFALDDRELVLLSAVAFDPGTGLASTVGLSVLSGVGPSMFGIPVGGSPAGPITLPDRPLLSTVANLVLVVGGAYLVTAAVTFSRYYDFRLVREGEELRYERGLLQRYSGTIPLSKVQRLSIQENVLKRRLGYASLGIETAGYDPGQSGGGGSEAAVPLAGRERVLSLARSIEDFGAFSIDRPPGRARERYAVRYGLVVLAGVALAYGLDAAFGLVPWWPATLVGLLGVPAAAHLAWRHRGYDAGEDYFVTRAGFWRRTTKIVPHYRIQTVVERATVFQRRRRLASVTADTASSVSVGGREATAIDRDAGEATALSERLADRLQVAVLEHKRRRRVRRLAAVAAETADAIESAVRTGGDNDSGDRS